MKAATHLTTINLREALASWKVEIVGYDAPPQATLLPSTWSNPCLQWGTVTPILLDRFPKKGLSVESILSEACERIGLPVPVKICHQPYSTLSGVPPVPRFRLLRSKDERPRWGVHATLRFEVPVRGPIVLGAGRYFGMGLMQPIWRDKDDR